MRSTQYSISQMNKEVTTAGGAHLFLRRMPDKRTPPAAPQPVPVMDRYSGLRLFPNSARTPHARTDAIKRTAPQVDRVNTIHRRRVTPKGLFRGIDSIPSKREQIHREGEALHPTAGEWDDSAPDPCRRNEGSSVPRTAYTGRCREAGRSGSCLQECSPCLSRRDTPPPAFS